MGPSEPNDRTPLPIFTQNMWFEAKMFLVEDPIFFLKLSDEFCTGLGWWISSGRCMFEVAGEVGPINLCTTHS